ncbi:MAG TPA: HEAT repeat domain-containing protein [Solirubrobacteraceae bacterium]|jgi:HEAT repeat protein
MTRLLPRRPTTASERLQRLDRRAGAAALLEAAHDPSIGVARRALGWLAHDGSLAEREALRDFVWTCDPMLATDVAQTLRTLGDRDTVDAAIQRLGAGPTAQRCRAARVLQRLADRRALPALCRALTDEDASVRAAALDALVPLGPDAGAARATALLLTDHDGEVRRRAVRAVGRMSRNPAAALRPALHDPLPAVRREAAVFASRLTADDLAVLFVDHDPQVRAAAAAGAGHQSRAAVVSRLASDPHPAVRLAAAQTLALCGGQEAFAALVAAGLDDAEATVRARALRLAATWSRARLCAALRAELTSENQHRREMALRALARAAAQISEAQAAELALDPVPAVRLALAQVAAKLVASPERVFSPLAHDADPTVRHAAATHRRRLAR